MSFLISFCEAFGHKQICYIVILYWFPDKKTQITMIIIIEGLGVLILKRMLQKCLVTFHLFGWEVPEFLHVAPNLFKQH